MIEIHAGDIVLAQLTPIRTDDLCEAAQRIIGQTFRWTAVRIIDETDDVGYAGQWRMELGRNDFDATGVRWTPLCDLSDIELVGRDQEIAVLNGPWNGEADE